MSTRPITIAKIQSGIVIDHIPAGKAFLISKVLGLNSLARDTGEIIAMGVNFSSNSMDKKDIIKVENLYLTRDMLNLVALMAPNATVSVIKEGKVTDKRKVEIPERVGDVVKCPDRFCITNSEEIPGKFLVIASNPLTMRCHYCETEFFGPLIKYKEK